jgi:hypothetical protein
MMQFGAKCSILAGLIFTVSGTAFFISQVGKFDWNSIQSISQYINNHPNSLVLWKVVNIGAALASFLAIAGVLALSDLLKPTNEGLTRWTSLLAVIGYSILAVSNIADLYKIQRLAAGYATVEDAARSALEIIGIGSLDPMLNLRFLTMGTWILSAGWLALKGRLLSKTLAIFAILAGLASLSYAFASFLDIQAITLIGGSMAVVFHPIWLIWVGLSLRTHKYHGFTGL